MLMWSVVHLPLALIRMAASVMSSPEGNHEMRNGKEGWGECMSAGCGDGCRCCTTWLAVAAHAVAAKTSVKHLKRKQLAACDCGFVGRR
jgi:hypothetical protein